MKTRQEAAEETALELKARYLHNQIEDIDELGVQCFLAGCEHVDREHRDFILFVRELMSLRNVTEGNGITFKEWEQRWTKCIAAIDKHLSSFTEREIDQLPFTTKD